MNPKGHQFVYKYKKQRLVWAKIQRNKRKQIGNGFYYGEWDLWDLGQ